MLISEGKRHDAGTLAESGLLQNFNRCAVSPTGHPMRFHGDPEYPLRVNLQAPFNAAMSAVRISVKWLFSDIINYVFQICRLVDFENWAQ